MHKFTDILRLLPPSATLHSLIIDLTLIILLGYLYNEVVRDSAAASI